MDPVDAAPVGKKGRRTTAERRSRPSGHHYIADYERADPFGANQHKFYVMYKNTTHAKLNYVNTTIGVNGCAGYAQARSFANVWIIGATADQIVTLYGKPFSIG